MYGWAYLKTKFTDGSVSKSNPFVLSVRGPQGPQGQTGEIDTYGIIKIVNQQIDERGSLSFDTGYQSEDGYIHFTKNGEDIDGFTPFFVKGGGGSGGGGNNEAVMTSKNTTGWTRRSISTGTDCYISLTWSSIEDETPTGSGSMTITVNQITALQRNVDQGEVRINLKNYISNGDNRVVVKIEDAYGNSRSLIFNVSVVSLNLTSVFDGTQVFTGKINFTYIPTAAMRKTMHFQLDGTELETVDIFESGRQQTKVIPAQTHGSHSLEVWFTADIDGSIAESNRLTYSLVCTKPGNMTPIIASDFLYREIDQYSTILIPYRVYDPGSLYADITVNGRPLSVDRTIQNLSYQCTTPGLNTVTITCGEVEYLITFMVRSVDINVKAEDKDLVLYLTAKDRSNAEEHPNVWTYKDIETSFIGFNWTSDGWMTDNDGVSVMRVPNGGTVIVPYKLFQNDFRTSGKTIELEFAARDVREIKPIIFSGSNLIITPQLGTLTSEQSKIDMVYKEGDHIRLTFVVQKRTEQRLIMIYINGIMSGVVQYPVNDNFADKNSSNLVIRGDGCSVDIYAIRVYDNSLSKEQVLGNWIADTANGNDLLARYERNDIFNEYSAIVIDKLPKNLPYLILEAPELPQYKGDKKTIRGSYVDPSHPDKNFTFENAQFNVQGTSSQFYARKNYKGKYKKGFLVDGIQEAKISLHKDGVPVNVHCYKADVASSEGANNVELVRLYHDTCPVKTPAMVTDPRIRWGIDGYPIVIFWNDGTDTLFLGKYNLNNDKGTPEVFGFTDEDQSWEFKNNTSATMIFKSDDLSDWSNDFEARHPEDYEDISKLQEVVSWVKSTDGDIEKFKMEFENWFNKESALFYYLFTEMFLMVDNRAKNMFLTYISDWDRWTFFPYDFDTALGINNEGGLLVGNSYALEDIDHLEGGANVFNGQESVLWNNVREAYGTELVAMYKDLRSKGVWSYEKVNGMFSDHQAKWPEAIFNEDAQFKYIDPLINDGNAAYLSMLQGAKTSQRAWWLFNRFEYMDSKYCSGRALTNYITLRGYAKSDVTLTPYLDMYTNIKYGSYLVSKRANNHESVLLECPLTAVNDTEIYIYNADELVDIGDLSGLKVGFADFSMAVRLESLNLGGTDDYTNANMTELHIGNSTLLKNVNLQGCVNLSGSIDLSGCSNLEVVDARRTSIQGIDLPRTGTLTDLYLPETLTNLTLINQPDLVILDIPTFENVTTLWLENYSTCINVLSIVSQMAAGSRIRVLGLEQECTTISEIDTFIAQFSGMTGLDEHGNNTPTAQIGGTMYYHGRMEWSIWNQYKTNYPYLNIVPDSYSYRVQFINGNGEAISNQAVISGKSVHFPNTATKTATEQYTYELIGWTDIHDSQEVKYLIGDWYIPKTDKIFWPVFKAVIRKLTVNFYNGSTLLETHQVPYGAPPVYYGNDPVDTNSGLPFAGWDVLIPAIVQNTNFYAKFVAKPIRETIDDTWEEITKHILDGDYKERYKIGDVKILQDSILGPLYMSIVGFDVDIRKDGSTMPISWLSEQLYQIDGVYLPNNMPNGDLDYVWRDSTVRKKLEKFKDLFPPTLRIEPVEKLSGIRWAEDGRWPVSKTYDSIFIPGLQDIGTGSSQMNSSYVIDDVGEVYPALVNGLYSSFQTAEDRVKTRIYETEPCPYMLRDVGRNNNMKPLEVGVTGEYDTDVHITNARLNVHLIGFAIGVDPITIPDDWETIIGYAKAGTADKHYISGDNKGKAYYAKEGIFMWDGDSTDFQENFPFISQVAESYIPEDLTGFNREIMRSGLLNRNIIFFKF